MYPKLIWSPSSPLRKNIVITFFLLFFATAVVEGLIFGNAYATTISTPSALQNLPGGSQSIATSINAAGQIVGGGSNSSGGYPALY